MFTKSKSLVYLAIGLGAIAVFGILAALVGAGLVKSPNPTIQNFAPTLLYVGIGFAGIGAIALIVIGALSVKKADVIAKEAKTRSALRTKGLYHLFSDKFGEDFALKALEPSDLRSLKILKSTADKNAKKQAKEDAAEQAFREALQTNLKSLNM